MASTPVKLQAPKMKVISAADASALALAVQMPAAVAPRTALAASVVAGADSTCILPHVNVSAALEIPAGGSTCILPRVSDQRARAGTSGMARVSGITPRISDLTLGVQAASARTPGLDAPSKILSDYLVAVKLQRLPRAKRKPSFKSYLMLGAGALLLSAGVVHTVLSALNDELAASTESAVESSNNPLPASVATRRQQASSRRSESRVAVLSRQPAAPATQKAAPALALALALRLPSQQKLLDRLRSEGYRPVFMPASQIKAPAEGQPCVTVYCLLREPLDELSERVWRDAGMLDAENEVISPYLRTLSISAASELRHLSAWQVVSVCLNVWEVPATAEVPASAD